MEPKKYSRTNQKASNCDLYTTPANKASLYQFKDIKNQRYRDLALEAAKNKVKDLHW